jgi:hypothetical protein
VPLIDAHSSIASSVGTPVTLATFFKEIHGDLILIVIFIWIRIYELFIYFIFLAVNPIKNVI